MEINKISTPLPYPISGVSKTALSCIMRLSVRLIAGLLSRYPVWQYVVIDLICDSNMPLAFQSWQSQMSFRIILWVIFVIHSHDYLPTISIVLSINMKYN